MYLTLLTVHSWLRWVVVILAAFVIIRSLMGWLSNSSYGKSDNAIAASFVGSLHLQLILGLILYFVYSPFGYAAFQMGMGEVMKNAPIRYWAVEHITTMILAVIIAQVGRSIAKKAKTSTKKHRLSFIFFSIAVFLIMISIPWNESGRMFRGL